jgi:hypothetical protein
MNNASTPHIPKVGDIYTMSWGYDQTNVNCFQVVRVSKKGVFIREISQSTVRGSEGFMCRKVMPKKDDFIADSSWCDPKEEGFKGNVETFRKISPDGRTFNFKGRYFAEIWDGQPMYNSWYA